jgi:DNA polymerase-3 subunit alpha
MNKNDFTHLHTHSVYSILDGENQLQTLVQKVKELGMKQIALTDHGTMMGILEFYKICKKHGIKPVLGVEAYITNDADGIPKEERQRDNNHLVIVAQNDTGLRNLFWLVSRAQTENFYFKPRISKTNLTSKRVDGLIATSACLGNEINRVGVFDPNTKTYSNQRQMEEAAQWYSKTFQGRYYLEIQDNDDKAGQQAAYNKVIQTIGKNNNIPMVITADAHYTDRKSSETHSMLMAMQFKKTLAEYMAAGEMKYGPWFYIRNPEEMFQAALKYDCEEAFWNTCSIGDMCNVDITTGIYKNPIFDIKSQDDYSEFLKSELGEENVKS